MGTFTIFLLLIATCFAKTAQTDAEPVAEVCPESTATTIVYNGHIYRTLTGFEKEGTGTGEEIEFSTLPDGYSIFSYDEDVDVNVVQAHPWNTLMIALEDSIVGTSKLELPVVYKVYIKVHAQKGIHSTCGDTAVMVRKPCLVSTQVCPDSTATTAVYNGHIYRTLTGFEKEGTGSEQEVEFSTLPDGYSIFSYDEDVDVNVVQAYPWNTDFIALEDSIVGTSKTEFPVCYKVYIKVHAQKTFLIRSTYGDTAVLVRKSCLVTTNIPRHVRRRL